MAGRRRLLAAVGQLLPRPVGAARRRHHLRRAPGQRAQLVEHQRSRLPRNLRLPRWQAPIRFRPGRPADRLGLELVLDSALDDPRGSERPPTRISPSFKTPTWCSGNSWCADWWENHSPYHEFVHVAPDGVFPETGPWLLFSVVWEYDLTGKGWDVTPPYNGLDLWRMRPHGSGRQRVTSSNQTEYSVRRRVGVRPRRSARDLRRRRARPHRKGGRRLQGGAMSDRCVVRAACRARRYADQAGGHRAAAGNAFAERRSATRPR